VLTAQAPAWAGDLILRLNFSSSARVCAERAADGDASDAALAACDRALAQERLDRQSLKATLLNRGILHARRNESVAALADFDAVIGIDARNAEAWLNRGVALIMLDRHGEAVAAMTEALSLGVEQAHLAYFNRAAAREALGDFRGAYEDYSTALEIQPDWGRADAERQRLAQRRQEWLAARLSAQNER
jgi:tetratricopeptide (TPR) repeat protein